MTIFLNKRESAFRKEELEGNYEYEFSNQYPGGIVVKENGKELFRLRTDQFGFSAPCKEEKYLYDLYLKKSDYADKECREVAEWIYSSRQLGGCFVWSISNSRNEQFPRYETKYNKIRGGSVDTTNRFYIQDRVDLTLLEIKRYYQFMTGIINEEEASGDRLWQCCDTSDSQHMKEWLNHFKNFKTYIVFFMMEDFVADENPKDIVNGGQIVKHSRNAEIKSDLKKEKLKEMLGQLNYMICQRSKKMEGNNQCG